MHSLTSLRKQLRPVYGEHADSVISLIGLNPSPGVLNSAQAGRLGNAHFLQVKEFFDSHPTRNRKLKQVPPRSLPSWFSRPVDAMPKKVPQLTASLHHFTKPRSGIPPCAVFYLNGRPVGEAGFEVHKEANRRVLMVHYLKQDTKHWAKKEARAAKGWKHFAMRELERIGRENNCGLILYKIGQPMASTNTSHKPIHFEMLDTYSRLPTQHGYKLVRVFKKPQEHMWYDELPTHWWAKRLR
jgi:hypothetical protein